MDYIAMVSPPDYVEGREGYWLIVGNNQVLVHVEGASARMPRARHPDELGLSTHHHHFLGMLDGDPIWAAGVDHGAAEAEGLVSTNLFSLYTQVDEPLWALAGKAVQITEWDRTHRFCGRCGEQTAPAPGERARKCPACGLMAFPRLAPAVITVVRRENEILLARGRTFGQPMYSALAGFVDPGETLEEAVVREIREEVGVDVKDVRYHSSQPWPFPHSLMIGFQATWAGGEIVIDESEIVDAQWYTADNLPNMPGRISIARRLIDATLEEMAG